MSLQPEGQFCQSCGMPLEKSEDFGTVGNGVRVNDYCHHCFQDGVFTEPDISMQAMIKRCAGIMAQKGIMPETQAALLMNQVIPKLKRWAL